MNKPLVWAELWAAMDANPNQWIETTEEMYWEMLEVLPPRKMIGKSFMVGEPLRSNGKGESIHACFKKIGNTYRAKNMTVNEFLAEYGYIPEREIR